MGDSAVLIVGAMPEEDGPGNDPGTPLLDEQKAALAAKQAAAQAGASEGTQEKVGELVDGAAAAAHGIHKLVSDGFEHELFCCHQEPIGCVLAFFCPYIPIAPFDATLEDRQVQFCEYCQAPSFYSVYRQRKNFRLKYAIQGSQYTDGLISYFCFPCAIVQHTRELAKEKKSDTPAWIQVPDFAANPADSLLASPPGKAD